MGRRTLSAAVDLTLVRFLVPWGPRWRVGPTRALLTAAYCLTIPACLLASTLGVSLPAALLTGQPTGGREHAEVAAGCAVLLAVAVAYAAVVDLLRRELGPSRFALARSPLRGLWLAAALPLLEVVIAERGLLIVWRASAQGAMLAGAAVYLARAGSDSAADLAWLALWLPLSYVVLGVVQGLRHGAGRADVRRLRHPVVLAMLVVVSCGATGAVLGRSPHLARVPVDESATPGIEPMLAGLASVSGYAVIVATALVVVAVALGVHAVLAVPDFWPTETPGRASQWDRLTAATRVTVLAACAAAATCGWRLGGGAALPEAAGRAVDRSVVLAAVAAAMVVASNGLLLLGQTRFLWHYRTLWEAGADAGALYRPTLGPSIGLGSVLALSVLAGSLALDRPRLGVVGILAIVCVLFSEHLMDSVFAQAHAGEGARAADTPLAVAAYLAALPAVLLAWSAAPWAPVVLAVLACCYVVGARHCFRLRTARLPIGAGS